MKSYVRSRELDTTQIEDEWILLDTTSYTVTTLNEIGGFCWNLLNRPITLDSIVQEITKNFTLPSKSINIDIEGFLDEMIKIGLVKHAN
ncbi:PqqD family protein [Bacillus sp. AK128]